MRLPAPPPVLRQYRGQLRRVQERLQYRGQLLRGRLRRRGAHLPSATPGPVLCGALHMRRLQYRLQRHLSWSQQRVRA
jgi:hypothetical protein